LRENSKKIFFLLGGICPGIAISFLGCLFHKRIADLLTLEPVLVLSISGGAGIFLVLIGSFFLYRFLQNHLIKSEFIADPVLLLSAKGIDLYELSEEMESISLSVLKEAQNIHEQIIELDKMIHQTNEDMSRIFQIVTRLATQEVTLIDDVGKTSEEIHFMFEVINSVVTEIDSRNEKMQNLVKKSQSGGEKVRRTNEVIKRISEKADEMLRMIDFINNITKETNLLAINAAIEASHSEDEGKGFAVIADEMKKLAVLTSQKAKEISKLIRGNIEEYREAHLASEESGEAFHFISSEIRIISGTIAEVVQTFQELKNRGSIVISKAQALDQSAVNVKDSSGEVYGEVVTMNDTFNSIRDFSEQVKNQMAMIENYQSKINTKAQNIKHLAKNINSETDRFLGILEKGKNEKV